MTVFRHKCPAEVNPKNAQRTTSGAYRDHIRTEYPVPAKAKWKPILGVGDAPLMRLGGAVETGREWTVAVCPDCDTKVVVTREAS